MADRDERIETLYHESAWDLAERVVDLEDTITRVRAELDEWYGTSDASALSAEIRTALDGTDG